MRQPGHTDTYRVGLMSVRAASRTRRPPAAAERLVVLEPMPARPVGIGLALPPDLGETGQGAPEVRRIEPPVLIISLRSWLALDIEAAGG